MTVERLNEIAKRTNEIRIYCRIHDNAKKLHWVDVLLNLSDELINIDINDKYFWLGQSLLNDIGMLRSELLGRKN